MENKAHAFLAGLFALFLGLATVGTVYWFGGQREITREYVVVTRQNVSGLSPQAQVRYRGIRVGKVRDIRLDPQDFRNILITIDVGRDVPLTRGTVARIGYQGLTGIGHVLLEDDGQDLTPLVSDDGPPRIPMQSSLLDEITDSGKEMVETAREVLTSTKELLNEQNRQRFSSILANLEATSGQMKPVVENLNAALGQMKQLLNDDNIRKLSRAAGEAGPLVAESRQLVGRLNAATEKLDAAIGDPGTGGVAALVPRVNEAAADIAATSRQFSRVLRAIEQTPQSLVFGNSTPTPGPGEAGFVAPVPAGRNQQ